MRLFLCQLGMELEKLLRRPRTYIGFGAFVLLEALIVTITQTLGGFEKLFRGIVTLEGETNMLETYFSCYSIAMFVVGVSVMLLGGIFLSLVAGDIVAKESEDGTLRMILARPASRFRVLLLKFLSCLIYTVLLTAFIAVTAWIMGVILRGFGGGMVMAAPERGIRNLLSADVAPYRFWMGMALMGICLCAVSALAFFFSCWRIKPAAATILAVSYLFVDMILLNTRLLENHEGFLITHHMSVWTEVFEDDISWAEIIHSLSALAGINGCLFVAGWMIIQFRDFKS